MLGPGLKGRISLPALQSFNLRVCQSLRWRYLWTATPPHSVDKLSLIIHDKQAELQALQAELTEALTGIESPDYEWAARVQPLIYALQLEIDRLEELRRIPDPRTDFAGRLSRLLTDSTVTKLELWTEINDWNYLSVKVLEIHKERSGHRLRCVLLLPEALQPHLHGEYTILNLRHLGWTAGHGGKRCWYKTQVKSPDQFDAFTQHMAVTMFEPLSGLWKRGPQHFRYV